MNWTETCKLHSSISDHTESNSRHNHKACKEFSEGAWNLTQNGLAEMVRQNSALFVSIALWQAHQGSIFTLGGTRMDHTLFHSCFSSFVVTRGSPFSSSSIFKNLYPVLQLYYPLLEWGQNSTSSDALQLNGIDLISFASSMLNSLSIISTIHCLLLGSIRISTVEFSNSANG